ncbi:MAG: T9SS type A sorting domain-containing protein [Saprospiraceae bacterium]|nr:T9SS type A sorting domain-containing protein [Saprospiraceae bacterium]
MNAMGAVVESIYSPQHVMDLTELPNGIYFIKIYSNNYQSYTQKMYKK